MMFVLINVAGGMRPEAYGCADDEELDKMLEGVLAGV